MFSSGSYDLVKWWLLQGCIEAKCCKRKLEFQFVLQAVVVEAWARRIILGGYNLFYSI
ncbi:hypothetical protein RchiOBHm_Chr2g0132621 [Rosa chinensis]|uniref:Uncharacterized protein n=1 Tax=Rosa chinensis TaxID=74649 RepID=A0A2P6RVD0_ROSCH|nr:hypothetical protein RchiOBHm_Chr2g0132621 [Rosa chinensis]